MLIGAGVSAGDPDGLRDLDNGESFDSLFQGALPVGLVI